MTDQRAFMNRLRSLYCIDREQLPELSDEQWERFEDNPHRFMARADDPTAAAIWREVERRQPKATESQLEAEMLSALKSVNAIIAEAALAGFRHDAGDWPHRLFFSQQATSRAIKRAEGRP